MDGDDSVANMEWIEKVYEKVSSETDPIFSFTLTFPSPLRTGSGFGQHPHSSRPVMLNSLYLIDNLSTYLFSKSFVLRIPSIRNLAFEFVLLLEVWKSKHDRQSRAVFQIKHIRALPPPSSTPESEF